MRPGATPPPSNRRSRGRGSAPPAGLPAGLVTCPRVRRRVVSIPIPPSAPSDPRSVLSGWPSMRSTSYPCSPWAMRMARSRTEGSRYFSHVSAGSRTCPSASTTRGSATVVIVSPPLRFAGRWASRGRQLVVAEPLTQRELVDLAGGGHRHLRHEHDVVRKPPAGHARAEELEQGRAVELAAGPTHDDQQRPLLPLR